MGHLELLLSCLTLEEKKDLFLKLESLAKVIVINEDGPVEKLLFRLSNEIENNENYKKEKLSDDLIYTILSLEDIEKLQFRLKSMYGTKSILEDKYIEKLLSELSQLKNQRLKEKEKDEEFLKNIKQEIPQQEIFKKI